MTDRRLFTPFVVVLMLALGSTIASAQLTVVKLKSGTTVEGFVVEESATSIKIETLDGKTVKYALADVESQEETKRTGNAELDAKLSGLDRSDAEALAKVAEWAKEQKIRAWQPLAREALKADPKNDTANQLLGHTKVGDRWYKSKTEADTARKAEREAEMKAKGFVRVSDGWIAKEDKALFEKDRTKFTKDDDGRWRSTEEVMKEKGYVYLKGKWTKAASPEDQEDMAKFKQLVGEEVWIHRTQHFRLAMMQFPPSKIEEYGKFCEETYSYFLKEMGKPDDFPLWPKPAEIWSFKDKAVKNEWLKHWRNRYGIDDDNFKWLTDGTNFSADLLGCMVTEGDDDVRNRLAHFTGHFTIRHFSRGLKGTPSWLSEAWGNYLEHARLGQGHIACSTKAQYGGEGGKADKRRFSTKDAKDRCKGMMKEGSLASMDELSKLDLNSLTGDNLAEGWAIVDWLMTNRKAEFVNWLENMNTASQEEALGKAIDGWTFNKLDEEWRAFVRKKY